MLFRLEQSCKLWHWIIHSSFQCIQFFFSSVYVTTKSKICIQQSERKKIVRFATIINSIELKMSPVFNLFISLFTANMCICINIHFRWNFSLTLSQAQETKNLCTTWQKKTHKYIVYYCMKSFDFGNFVKHWSSCKWFVQILFNFISSKAIFITSLLLHFAHEKAKKVTILFVSIVFTSFICICVQFDFNLVYNR